MCIFRRLDNIQHFVLIPYRNKLRITFKLRLDFIHACGVIWMRRTRKDNAMAKNLLLEYSEELATKCELLCKSISGNSNTVFQLRKSSSSVFANITEAQYPQSLADMLSKFKIARKECAETESWLKIAL